MELASSKIPFIILERKDLSETEINSSSNLSSWNNVSTVKSTTERTNLYEKKRKKSNKSDGSVKRVCVSLNQGKESHNVDSEILIDSKIENKSCSNSNSSNNVTFAVTSTVDRINLHEKKQKKGGGNADSVKKVISHNQVEESQNVDGEKLVDAPFSSSTNKRTMIANLVKDVKLACPVTVQICDIFKCKHSSYDIIDNSYSKYVVDFKASLENEQKSSEGTKHLSKHKISSLKFYLGVLTTNPSLRNLNKSLAERRLNQIRARRMKYKRYRDKKKLQKLNGF